MGIPDSDVSTLGEHCFQIDGSPSGTGLVYEAQFGVLNYKWPTHFIGVLAYDCSILWNDICFLERRVEAEIALQFEPDPSLKVNVSTHLSYSQRPGQQLADRIAIYIIEQRRYVALRHCSVDRTRYGLRRVGRQRGSVSQASGIVIERQNPVGEPRRSSSFGNVLVSRDEINAQPAANGVPAKCKCNLQIPNPVSILTLTYVASCCNNLSRNAAIQLKMASECLEDPLNLIVGYRSQDVFVRDHPGETYVCPREVYKGPLGIQIRQNGVQEIRSLLDGVPILGFRVESAYDEAHHVVDESLLYRVNRVSARCESVLELHEYIGLVRFPNQSRGVREVFNESVIGNWAPSI